jgi:hypothetical protein
MWGLSQQVLEVRFTQQYTYWDRMGAIAQSISREMSGCEVVRAAADKTIIKNQQEGLQFTFSHQIANLIHDLEDNPDGRVREASLLFFSTVLVTLEVSQLTRIGNRLTFRREFDDNKSARGYVESAARTIGVTSEPFLKTEDPRIASKKVSNVTLRLEDDAFGIWLELNSGHVDYLAPKWAKDSRRIEGQSKTVSHHVALDLDFYTREAMTTDKFLPYEFLQSNRKMAETRFLPLLPR